ncbi:MAG: P44/Msp2 family outer membrane protein, partial [Pseudomonadota bacterium]
FRGGLEVSYTQADVDTHTGVSAGGASIDEVDAAFLTGDADPLGATIADIVADGQGDISGVYVFANGYFDFNKAGPIQPYIGAGVGIGFIDVLYEPSGVGIVDDDQTKFAYQAIAGLTYDTGQNFEIFGQYNYRATEDVEVDVDLFPARLDIENRQHLLQAGVRFKFG